MLRQKTCFLLSLLLVVVLGPSVVMPAAATLPERLTDEAFWNLIDGASEPGGVFPSENFLSNETGYQTVLPTLKQIAQSDGVYLGVGPEQNFTYIAAIRPKMAFIVDIRRQNMLQHLIYKVAFELSADRADFLSRLFSRKRPAGLMDASTPDQLFTAYMSAAVDNEASAATLREIKDALLRGHKFKLTAEDEAHIDRVFTAFRDFGPQINYSSGANSLAAGIARNMPNYTTLMIANDGQGAQRSFLANEENYRFVREMEMRNMIVPLTGDFGGVMALRTVAQYLKVHNATVTAFYLSNVEQYLFQSGRTVNGGAASFYDNVAALPLAASSVFIRSGNGGRGGGTAGAAPGGMGSSSLASMLETVAAFKDGRIRAYNDVFTIAPPPGRPTSIEAPLRLPAPPILVAPPATLPARGGAVTPPALLNQIQPSYTNQGRQAKIQGAVVLRVTILADGTVDPNIVVVKSLGYGLDEKAIEAVRNWKFKPALKDGVPTNFTATIEVSFKLI